LKTAKKEAEETTLTAVFMELEAECRTQLLSSFAKPTSAWVTKVLIIKLNKTLLTRLILSEEMLRQLSTALK